MSIYGIFTYALTGAFHDNHIRIDQKGIQCHNPKPTLGKILLLAKGSGAKVWNLEGREYLDFGGRIAVNNVGHCTPKYVQAIQTQASG